MRPHRFSRNRLRRACRGAEQASCSPSGVPHGISDLTVFTSERQIQNLRMTLDRDAPTGRPRIRDSVLLISQHPEDKELLQQFLTALACPLESASSWAAAMRTLQRQSFVVVICESQLPDSTWEQVLSSLGRLAHPPPLIVISRPADEQLWAAVLNQGGFDVLAKPLARDEVVRVVGHALDHCERFGVQREIHMTQHARAARK
jgi:CheY-like chemotaxis protein